MRKLRKEASYYYNPRIGRVRIRVFYHYNQRKQLYHGPDGHIRPAKRPAEQKWYYGDFLAYKVANGAWYIGQYLGPGEDDDDSGIRLRGLNVTSAMVHKGGTSVQDFQWRYCWNPAKSTQRSVLAPVSFGHNEVKGLQGNI